MRKTCKQTFIFFLAFFAALFFSCKTAPHTGIENYFGIIGNGADVYAFIPAANNRALIEEILPFESAKNMRAALNRTYAVYSGIFVKDGKMEMRICAAGNYPHLLSGSFFRKTDGWNHEKTSGGIKYYSSRYLDTSLPKKNIAIMLFGTPPRRSMEETVQLLENPESVSLPPSFENLLKTGAASGKIGLFVRNADFFLYKILGIKLGFPIDKIEMYLTKDTTSRKEVYNYNLDIEVNNANMGFAARLLLSKILKAEVKIDGNKIIVENGKVSAAKLGSIVKSLYK